ncbi:hypothetical protein [Nocardioides sp. zg-DK7169]|uniref:hypothetical protein n=1 Tax=Nocardioides sp. zg-DK7169 TaxID=2736600 RepID=UPI0015561EC4|nr:hypothetical protein [Nocardioides sp. zg-DK7169]NPC98764.1 hypothetical protein [Nocardioides sp. zg-DK7169]
MTRHEHDERVRRLLHDARHDEPIPEDIATRLDRVLAQLSADEPVDAPSVHEIAARRRRRAGGLLVAAAAVVVASVGLDQALDRGEDAADSSAATAGGSADAQDSVRAERDQAGSAQSTLPRSKAPTPVGGPVDVHADRFTSEARAILRTTEDRRAELRATTAAPQDSDAPGLDANPDAQASSAPPTANGGAPFATRNGTAWFTCDPAPWGPGRLVAVRYDGEPAVIAVRPPAGDTRVVEVLQCGTGAILRSVTLPRR